MLKKLFKILGLDKKLIVDKKIKSYVKNKIRSKNKKISNKTNWKPTSNLKKMISIMLKEELIWNFKNAKFKKSETLIISEIGINHNGDINLAKKLIDYSLNAGANAVKFQIRNLAEIYNKKIISDPNNTQSGSHIYLIN